MLFPPGLFVEVPPLESISEYCPDSKASMTTGYIMKAEMAFRTTEMLHITIAIMHDRFTREIMSFMSSCAIDKAESFRKPRIAHTKPAPLNNTPPINNDTGPAKLATKTKF